MGIEHSLEREIPVPTRLHLVRSTLAALCVAGLMSGQAFAQDGDESHFNRGGYYIAIGGAFGMETRLSDELNRAAGTVNLIQIDSSGGFKGRIGARGRILGGELEYEYLPSFGSIGPLEVPDYEMMTTTANFKVHLPLGRIEPFFLFGVGFSRSNVPQLGTTGYDAAIRGGAGVNWFLTEKVAVTLDASYVWTGAGDNEFLDYVSIGYALTYQF